MKNWKYLEFHGRLMIQPILSRMAGWRNSFHIFGFTKNILQQIPHNMSTLVSEYQGTHLPTEVCTRGGGRCIWQIYNWTKIYIYSTFPKAKKSAREIWFWRFDENLWWREEKCKICSDLHGRKHHPTTSPLSDQKKSGFQNWKRKDPGVTLDNDCNNLR